MNRRLLALLAVLVLVPCAGPPDALAANPGKPPKPLEYQMFGHTLEDSPKAFRESLKRDKWLHTKTETRYGYEVMCFTSVRQGRLFSNAYVAYCDATGQTVGVYIYGEDGEAILAIARDRFGITGNDLANMPKDSAIGGPMRIHRKYRREYPNITVSFYPNTPFSSYTLALESQEAMRLCTRQNQAETAAARQLARDIENASRQAAAAAAE